ncbi:MAG: cupredoxin domain-containing protein [Thermomicrobiales bacterium]
MSHLVRTGLVIGLSLAGMLLVGSVRRETDASPAPATQTTSAATAGLWQAEAATPAVAAPVTVEVPIKGFLYIPQTVTIRAGDSIAWTDMDNAPHTATGVGAAKSALDSGAIIYGQTFTQEFDTAGTFPYFCVYHPNMLGTVVVTP